LNRELVEGRKRQPRWIIGAWHSAWPVGVMALLCVVAYWDVLWLPANYIVAGNDLTNMFLHWLRFAVSSVQQGQFPFWNPYLFSGVPFVANPQPALFYPPTWLALVVPIPKALGLIIVLHLWIAGTGVYLWLRAEGASVVGALMGGIVFAFSGYTFVRVYAGHMGVVTTGAWLPVILWAYQGAVKHRSWGLAVVGGLPVGLSILAGHTATFIYVALGLAALACFCSWESWRTKRTAAAVVFPLAQASVMVLVGLALSAVQLLPMVEFVQHSVRQAAPSYEFASRFSWPPGYLLTLLVPDFFGEPVRTGYWGDGLYDEFVLYIGVLPVLLTLVGLRLRHRLSPFLFALGLGALMLAFGYYGSLHRLFYRFVPLFDLTRAPARAGFLFTLAGAAICGLTVTALQSSPVDGDEERARLLEPITCPLVLVVVGGAVVWMVAGFGAFAWGRESISGAGRLWHQANQVALFLVWFLLSVGLLMVWRSGSTRDAGLGGLALGLVLLDLWAFGGVINPAPVPESAYWRKVSGVVTDPQDARVLPWNLNDYYQNGGMEFGLYSAFGYDPLVLQRYETFIESWPDYRARTYDLLNARYLITTAPLEQSDEASALRLVLDRPSVYVYERPNALPRAWVVSQVEVADDETMLDRIHATDLDLRTTALLDTAVACEGLRTEPPSAEDVRNDQVQIVEYEGSRIDVQVQSEGGLLVLSEVEYPGWQATVDGEPTPVLRADYVLRAVCVPAGEYQVVFTYYPPLLKFGLVVTGLMLLGVFGCGIMILIRWGGNG
jgi:hypothetical protein